MPEARKCVVKMRDPEGIEHAVQVQAGSLYEAASLGLKQFRRSAWSREATFEGGMLQVEVWEARADRVPHQCGEPGTLAAAERRLAARGEFAAKD